MDDLLQKDKLTRSSSSCPLKSALTTTLFRHSFLTAATVLRSLSKFFARYDLFFNGANDGLFGFLCLSL